jgi:hypothetical protein
MRVASFLLSLLFCPEDGGDMFLWNVGMFQKYVALEPRNTADTAVRTSSPTSPIFALSWKYYKNID